MREPGRRKRSGKAKDASGASGGLRMRDLERLTGVPRSTIHFYVRQRLLGEPARNGRTSALYPPEAVERLRRIRDLQARERLTLPEIRRVLAIVDEGGDAKAGLELLGAMAPLHRQAAVYDRARFLAATGLTRKQLETAERLGLIAPTARDEYDAEDVATGTQLARVVALGESLDSLSFYPEIGERLIDREIAIRNRLVERLSVNDAIRATHELTVVAKQLRAYVLHRILYRKTVLAGRRVKETSHS